MGPSAAGSSAVDRTICNTRPALRRCPARAILSSTCRRPRATRSTSTRHRIRPCRRRPRPSRPRDGVPHCSSLAGRLTSKLFTSVLLLYYPACLILLGLACNRGFALRSFRVLFRAHVLRCINKRIRHFTLLGFSRLVRVAEATSVICACWQPPAPHFTSRIAALPVDGRLTLHELLSAPTQDVPSCEVLETRSPGLFEGGPNVAETDL
jgi:hypothetical protein